MVIRKFVKTSVIGGTSSQGLKQDQEDDIQHLTNAKSYWTKYSAIYDSQYKPALICRIGYINIPELIEKTDRDIKIARNLIVGFIKEYKKARIIYP